jgi:hypothetical protein
MRKPKSRKGSAPAEAPAPGGRAWARARQFALERGLPMPVEPPREAAPKTRTTRKAKRAKGS